MHWFQFHLRSFKGQLSLGTSWTGDQEGLHSPRQVTDSWQLWHREWHNQDNRAVPSVPECHNHPWSNSLHEYCCRVTQANDTGDIHHFQRAGLQTWTAQNQYTLLPSLLPTLTACCNPPGIQSYQSTSLDQSWELHGVTLGNEASPAHGGELHCTDFMTLHVSNAGLLPEKTASHKVLNGYHWDFSSRILQVALLADPFAWTQFCWF